VVSSTVKLTGWKAVVVLVAVVGFGVFRFLTARQELTGEGRGVLESWIAGELIRPRLSDRSMAVEEKEEAILGASGVRIRSLKARSSLDDMVFRVELEPSPDYPPGTELTRYYRMTYSTISGWRHRGPTSALGYHLALF